MPRITISYRRDDSGVITGRIFDRLAAHYGRDAVFRDIDNIPPGVDFRQHIAQVLDESDILLAIVGPRWLGARGGQNRLDDEADPVRLEIETGLRKAMPVIPVLVLRAAMPRVGQLPDTVKDFAYRHAVQVDAGQDFDIHSARLIRAMDRILRQKQGLPPAPGSDAAELPGPTDLAPPPDEDDEPLADAPFAPAVVEAPARPRAAAPVAVAREAAVVERIEPAAVVPRPAAREVVAPAPAERGRSGLVLGAVLGLAVGAAVAAAAVIVMRPSGPPDVVALATAKEAADAKALTLQAELSAAQKKLDTAQGNLDAAQKQANDANKHAQDLQTTLAAQQDAATKAKADIDKLNAQVKSLGDQQNRADQDEKNLAAQKSAAADAAAQLALAQDQAKTFGDKLTKAQDQIKSLGDQLAAAQGQAKSLGDQLAAEKKAHQDAADQVKTLQAQLASAPAQAATAGGTQVAAMAPPPPADDSGWSADQRKQAQTDLVTVGYLQGTPDGNFGTATRTAIKQLQSLTGEAETGVMTDAEASALRDMAQRLSALLNRGATSPDGVPAAAVKGAPALYQRAWAAEKGSNGTADPAEAIYWYGLAAAEGDGKALTNLATLLIRGQGIAKPDPDGATVLWEVAAARGEVTAMFNLGAMYEHGVGVTADPDKAKAWYQRAAARGDTGARAALKRLGA